MIGEALVARGYVVDVAMMDEGSPTPSLEGYDLMVILGSKYAVYDHDVRKAWFDRELGLMSDAEARALPILGICFGAQALCVYHGGEVTPSERPEIGWFEVEALNGSQIAPGPWFEYHFDQCDLPSGAQVWARSASAVQAFAIGRNVGVQFHPEVDHLQLRGWFEAADDDVRDFGVDTEQLVAETEQRTPAARLRAHELVDLFLRHVGR
jgi:GMP synthase-like glutamine amidotransferase